MTYEEYKACFKRQSAEKPFEAIGTMNDGNYVFRINFDRDSEIFTVKTHYSLSDKVHATDCAEGIFYSIKELADDIHAAIICDPNLSTDEVEELKEAEEDCRWYMNYYFKELCTE